MKRSMADLMKEVADEARKRKGPMAIVLRFERRSKQYPFQYMSYRSGGDGAGYNYDLKELARSGGEPIGIVGISETPDQWGMHFYNKPFAEYNEDQQARYYLECASKGWQNVIGEIERAVMWGNIKPDLN